MKYWTYKHATCPYCLSDRGWNAWTYYWMPCKRCLKDYEEAPLLQKVFYLQIDVLHQDPYNLRRHRDTVKKLGELTGSGLLRFYDALLLATTKAKEREERLLVKLNEEGLVDCGTRLDEEARKRLRQDKEYMELSRQAKTYAHRFLVVLSRVLARRFKV